MLRFSNAMTNPGEGLWWIEPCDLAADPAAFPLQLAYQVFGDGRNLTEALPPASADPGFLGRCGVGAFEFHSQHCRWHIADVAEHKVCSYADFVNASAAGDARSCTAHGAQAQKVTFCLLDWIKLGDNTATSDPTRNFFACETGFQGITPGWSDRYHHSLPDQDLDMTGIADGRYVLLSKANPAHVFVETDTGNNASWAAFDLARANTSNGQRKILVTGTACDDAHFLAEPTADVAAFTGDATRQAAILAALCGGAQPNR